MLCGRTELKFKHHDDLFVLDGRVPDGGARVKLGLAHMHKLLKNKKKLIIGLQTDIRDAFIGSRLNPMVLKSFDYIFTKESELINYLKK